ncbi:MAG: STAS domain-containing protein [Clostridia bacterium]|nr:STAS domain-containing protein [Clostridia bacterium]
MDIKTNKNGNEFTVAPEGEINILTAPELEAAINSGIDGISLLTLDFSSCDYVSSAGLRVLLATFKTLKANGAEMRFTNLGENFTEVLRNTGLDAVFGIE